MKTIGLLGGIGPQATMALVERIHHHAQQIIPSKGNSGYPPLNVHYFRSAPVQVGEDMKPMEPMQPNPRFLEAAKILGAHSDFLILGANGPHAFQSEVEQSAGVELLSMVELAVKEIENRDWQNVGLLGLGVPQIYVDLLQSSAIEYSLLSEGLRGRLDQAIFKVMEGRAGNAEAAIAQEAIAEFRRLGVDGILLGCTEVPLLLKEAASEQDLIDPGELLARAAVERAIA